MKGDATHGKIVVNNNNNNNNKSGKKKRENMAEIRACINISSFLSLFSKPTLWNPKISNK